MAARTEFKRERERKRRKNFIAELSGAPVFLFSVVVIAALRGEEIWGKEAR